jgi:hypothetical protein
MSAYIEKARKRLEEAEHNYKLCPSNLNEIMLNSAWENLKKAEKKS